jgi:hypothetical protein
MSILRSSATAEDGPGCKAREVMRNEAYCTVRRRDE